MTDNEPTISTIQAALQVARKLHCARQACVEANSRRRMAEYRRDTARSVGARYDLAYTIHSDAITEYESAAVNIDSLEDKLTILLAAIKRRVLTIPVSWLDDAEDAPEVEDEG